MIPRSGYWNRQFRRWVVGAGVNQFQDYSECLDGLPRPFPAAILDCDDIVVPASLQLAPAAITLIQVPHKACQV